MARSGTVEEQKATLKKDLVCWGSLAYLFGVYSFGVGWSWFFGLPITLLGVIFFVFRQAKNSKEKIIFIALTSFLFLSGTIYHATMINLIESKNNFKIGEVQIFQGIVSSEPSFSEKSQQFKLRLDGKESGSVNIITELIPEFKYGDRLEINGRIEKKILTWRASEYSAFFPKINFLEHKNSLRSYLIQFKQSLISPIKKFLERDEASLLAGLTLGARSDFSSKLKDQMAKSGTTHIVALSGYNIAILVLVVSGILSSFISRKKLIWLMSLIIFFFVLMVGGEASVVRAALMALILLLARHFGRKNDLLNAIILTAVCMVLYDPSVINFDLGFQLSFLSLLGIIYLTPWIENLFIRKKLKNNTPESSFLNWRENLATTIAAQLAVAPIIIQNFNQFSLGSVVANVLILSTVPFAMLLGFALVVFGSIFSAFGFVLAKVASILLAYQILIIKIFSHLSIEVSGGLISGIFFLLYYSGLFLLVRIGRKSERLGLV